jgi:protein-S-isoprenylcysteine O-methyltransferase Ste14
MDFTTILIIWGVVLVAVLFLVIRLAVRWIVRMTIVGIILLALIGGGFFWWWTNRLSTPQPQNRQRAQPTRRASSQ